VVGEAFVEASQQCEGRLPRRPVFALAIHSRRKQVLVRSATISFLGDGDMASERVRYSLDLGIVPPQAPTPEMARALYPNAER